MERNIPSTNITYNGCDVCKNRASFKDIPVTNAFAHKHNLVEHSRLSLCRQCTIDNLCNGCNKDQVERLINSRKPDFALQNMKG